MGKRKRLLREKRAAKHQKAAMMRLKYETDLTIKNSMNQVIDIIFDDFKKQESYR